MSEVLRCDLSVLIQPAPDVSARWLAHCLNFDIMTQGSSPTHAREMIAEAVTLAILDDVAAGRGPATRSSALPDEWAVFERVMSGGHTTSFDEIEAAERKPGLIATLMHLAVRLDATPATHEPFEIPAWTLASNDPSDRPVAA